MKRSLSDVKSCRLSNGSQLFRLHSLGGFLVAQKEHNHMSFIGAVMCFISLIGCHPVCLIISLSLHCTVWKHHTVCSHFPVRFTGDNIALFSVSKHSQIIITYHSAFTGHSRSTMCLTWLITADTLLDSYTTPDWHIGRVAKHKLLLFRAIQNGSKLLTDHSPPPTSL